MKKYKKFMMSYGLILPALLFYYLAGGDHPFGPALFLGPIFLLAFFRKSGIVKGFFIALPLVSAAMIYANNGMLPAPFPVLVIYTVKGTATLLIAYVLSCKFSPSLPMWLRTLLFPTLVTALLYYRTNGASPSWFLHANAIDDLVLLQLVSLTGIWGITFLIHWIASVVNEIWENRSDPKKVRNLTVSTILIVFLIYGFGFLRLKTDDEMKNTINVAGIMPVPEDSAALMESIQKIFSSPSGNDEVINKVREKMKGIFYRLLSCSVSTASCGTELVLWSEGAVLIFQEDEKEILSEAIHRAKENKIYLGLGLAVMDLKIRQGKKGLSRCIHNKLVLISPEGKVAWQHSKSKLTPGIEAACMIPGDGKLKSESKGNAIITGAICYEMDFPEYIREAGKMNANLLLAPSNDWADIKNTHARMARLRAIENGVAILRSASGGISIAVDSSGRVLSRSDYYHNAGEVVFCALPLENISTVYAKIGDLFPWICIISSILMILLSLFRFFASRNIN